MDRIKIFVFANVLLWSGLTPTAALTSPAAIFVGPSRVIHTDDQLVVEVQLDSAGQQVNAAEVSIQYPTDRLKVLRVGREQSIWTVWAEEPSWDANLGTIRLVGGRPNGIIASRATMATLYFTALRSGPAEINLVTPDSKVFRHDGQGTPVELPTTNLTSTVVDPLAGGFVLRSATHPTLDYWSRNGTIDINWDIESDTLYSYALSQDRLEIPDDNPDQLVVRATYTGLADGVYYFSIKSRASGQDWSEVTQRRFLLDQTPPEIFTIETISGSAIPDQTLLSWLATDKTSGVENYRLLIAGRDQGVVTSPLLMKASWSGEDVTIIATDAAGNRRTVERLAAVDTPWSKIVGLAVTVLALGGIFWLLASRARRGRL